MLWNARCQSVLLHFFWPPTVHKFLLLYRNDNPGQNNKKAKKNALKNANAAGSALDPSDQAALNRRAQRFQREHELERQKNNGGGYSGNLKANYNHSHLFESRASSGSASPWGAGGYDDPEADPVCSKNTSIDDRNWITLRAECSQLGSLHYCWNKSRNIQGLFAPDHGT